MAVIPAWIVRSNLDDPRKIPYLLVWKDERDGGIKEVVRLTCHVDPYLGSPHRYVELKRTDERQAQEKRLEGNTTILQIVLQKLPRNGGRALLLLCPHCGAPRRHVYGWEWNRVAGRSNSARQISWRCRSCARLRYCSEGGYLRPAYGRLGQLGVMLRASWGNLPRPASWLPYMFTSMEDPGLDEIVRKAAN